MSLLKQELSTICERLHTTEKQKHNLYPPCSKPEDTFENIQTAHTLAHEKLRAIKTEYKSLKAFRVPHSKPVFEKHSICEIEHTICEEMCQETYSEEVYKTSKQELSVKQTELKILENTKTRLHEKLTMLEQSEDILIEKIHCLKKEMSIPEVQKDVVLRVTEYIKNNKMFEDEHRTRQAILGAQMCMWNTHVCNVQNNAKNIEHIENAYQRNRM